MLKINRPPAHSIDDKPQWIHRSDPAWDLERFKREAAALGERADEHPLIVYYSGATRFSLEAEITVPEAIRGDGPAKAAPVAWLIGEPTIFELKSVSALDWAIATANTEKMDWELARRGIVSVTNIDLNLERDAITGLVSTQWLDALSSASRSIVDQLGGAIYRLSRSERASAEGKP